MRKTSILLVDDHQIVMDGISAIISQNENLEIIGQLQNGKAAIHFTNLQEPDLIIMDLDMPEMNGIEASRHLKKEHPNVKIIILSLHSEKSVIQQMIQIGVDGYLFKNCDQSDFIQAIETVISGKKYFSGDVTIALSAPIKSGPTLSNSSLYSLLTKREIEVIKAIAEGKSNKEISKELFLSQRTVDTHRQNIMKKLELKKVVGLIKFAIQNGLA